MDDHSPATGGTRIAIEFLTLWIEPGDTARRTAAGHIIEVLNDPATDTPTVVAGLLNLNMLLLFSLAKERGATDDDMYQKAGDILREVSPQLPE